MVGALFFLVLAAVVLAVGWYTNASDPTCWIVGTLFGGCWVIGLLNLIALDNLQTGFLGGLWTGGWAYWMFKAGGAQFPARVQRERAKVD